MPNYTKKKHRTFRKKIGGVKKNKERSQSQSQWYPNWQGRYGEPGSIAVDLRRSYRQHLDPVSPIAGNEISKSRFMNTLRYLSQFFSRKSKPIVETPPSATIVETPPPHPSIKKKSGKKSGTKSPIKKRNSAKTTKRAFPDEYYSPRHASTLHQTTTETERVFPDEYYYPRHTSTLHQKISKKARKLQSTRRLRSSAS